MFSAYPYLHTILYIVVNSHRDYKHVPFNIGSYTKETFYHILITGLPIFCINILDIEMLLLCSIALTLYHGDIVSGLFLLSENLEIKLGFGTIRWIVYYPLWTIVLLNWGLLFVLNNPKWFTTNLSYVCPGYLLCN